MGYTGYERLWPLFRVIVMIFEDECNNFESDIEIQGKKLGKKKTLKEKGEK